MCGFAGILDPTGRAPDDVIRPIVERMAERLAHRGPDGAGAWTDASAGIALGFRRLAVVDRSDAGAQPMRSASGRFVLVLNGEIYNAPRLRRELELEPTAPAFRGHSDTEVALAAIEAWGLDSAVERFVGMFALALWDSREQRLHLVRDRVGVKPLYIGRAGPALVFGSELKALRAHPAFDATIDHHALAGFLRASYIRAPRSIYANVEKLTPGTILTVDGRTGLEIERRRYWSARDVAEDAIRHRFAGSDDEALRALEHLLRDAVGLRLVADVPIGAFLSGGVDSSLVVAMMQSLSNGPVRTFSIGLADDPLDESGFARAVARHLGTDHTELRVGAEDALEVVPLLPTLYDEPFADSSQIPTYLVSALARRDVTVSLSGDGGDELFGGYAHYAHGRAAWRSMAWMPAGARRATASALRRLSVSQWDRVFATAAPMLPRSARRRLRGEGVAKLAGILGDGPAMLLNRGLWERREHSARILLPRGARPAPLEEISQSRDMPPDVRDLTEQMMLEDQMTYLPDDILVKVDRASMGVGLEVRGPLLDHRLMRFAWSLPPHMKVRGGEAKWLLKRLLHRYVPAPLVDRPKTGFSVPIGDWLRGPLRDWAEDLLDERRMRQEGLLATETVRAMWTEHLTGSGDRPSHLWDVLMLQAWLRNARPTL
jgi:asparagine synthase (glutamine-hydrolysing)